MHHTLKKRTNDKMSVISGHLLFLDIVVVDFDAEDDYAADSSNEVGDKQRPKHVGLMQQALQHKTHATYTHHQERGQGDAVGIAGADGVNSLRQVAQNHCDAGHPAEDLEKNTLFSTLPKTLPRQYGKRYLSINPPAAPACSNLVLS